MKREFQYLNRTHGRQRAVSSLLLDDESGLATIEYVIVLVTVLIGVCAALLTWWQPALELFEARVAWLALPVP